MKSKNFKPQSAIDGDYIYNTIYDYFYDETGIDCAVSDQIPIKKNMTNIFDIIWGNVELIKIPMYKILRYICFDGPI